MAEEGKGIALAILGIVAVIAVVGLVLLFKGATGQFAGGGVNDPKIYTRDSFIDVEYPAGDVEDPQYGYYYNTYEGRWAAKPFSSAGGAQGGPGSVYGEGYGPSTVQPGDVVPYAYDDYYSVQIAEDRAPSSIPAAQGTPCGDGFCPKGSSCIPDPRRVPSSAEPISGYPGCYALGSTI
jgi:hypothetical protein